MSQSRGKIFETSKLLVGRKGDADDQGQHAVPETHNDESPTSTPIPSRPNKYHGPSSTWRNWTAPERELAASLDQLIAKDLSVHLYNAFKLKQRKRSQHEHPQAHMSKVGDEAGDMNAWTPSKVWTAWPLPPETVPRESEGEHWAETVTLPPPYIVRPRMPGDALRELLVAQVLRKARYNFWERKWEGVDEEQAPAKLNSVVMADDEQASEILRPTIQHALSRLDCLLMGLHHARSACLGTDDSASECQSQRRGRAELRSNTGKRKRANDAETGMASDAPVESESESSMASKSKSRTESRTQRARSSSRIPINQKISQRKSRLGLRDWSDVLGVASLTGWHPAVVEKAATRCAGLFEEAITFRTLKEGHEGHSERSHFPSIHSPIAVSKGEEAGAKTVVIGNGRDEEAMVGGVHVDGFLQAIEGKKSWKYKKKEGQRHRG